jgi:uncharacterized protein (DUF697 family)
MSKQLVAPIILSLSEEFMTTITLIETAYQLATAADKAVDDAVHKDIAQIVKFHAKVGLAAAWIPAPGADLAAVGANIWTMYVRINKALGIPFSKSVMKSLAAGVGTNLLASLPILGISSILKSIPGLGTLAGSAAMSVSIYAVIMAAGIVYMKALTFLLGRGSELTEVNLRAAVESLSSTKESMKQIFREADKAYEAAKASGELARN